MSNSNGNQANPTQRRVRIIPAVVGVVAAILLAVLGIGVVANAADQVTITITNTLSPANVTVNIGTTITWTNNDTNEHELRSESGPAEFRTDTLDPGQSASLTFNTPGTYTYNDHRNDGSAAYQGTIVVTDGAIPATSPAATPGAVTPPPAATPPPPTTASVQLAGSQFSPASVTVGVGGTVSWLNNDGSKHTVTANDASFDSGTLNAGGTFVHTFTTRGSFTYVCDFHGNMRGTVIVAGAGGTPPAAAPAAAAPLPVAAPAAAPIAALAAPAAAAPGATSASVAIAGNVFSPATVSLGAGGTVTWVNNDTVTHTATADDQSFNSGLLKRAISWSQIFATPGTFTYFCEIHPEMIGTVVVTAPDGSAPAAAATPAAAAPAAAAPAAAAPTDGATAAATGSSAGSTGAATGSIKISDSGFTPASFRVAVGGTLTFANNGKAMHTVTADNGSFDSDMIKSGGTWAHPFTTAGSFSYSCILHPNMRGTIDVGAGGSGGSGGRGGAIESARSTGEAGTLGPVESAPTTTAASATDSAIQPVNVDVADNEFNPNPATVALGGTVTWKLVGAAAHTVTADDQSFNSGLLKAGESYEYTFTTLGSFAYTCLVHPGMIGTIEVVPPEQAAALLATPASGDAPQAQQGAAQPVVASAITPPTNDGLLSNTLLGIAAVLAACCALIFALKSFLKVLSDGDREASAPVSPTEGLAPSPS